MAVPFSQTTRALRAEGFCRPAWRLGLAALLLAAWGSWLLVARIPILVAAEAARLEAAAHPVEAPVSGRVAAISSALGEDIEAAAVLLSLESVAESLSLAEARAHRAALEGRLEALRRQQAQGREALRGALEAAAAGRDEAGARWAEADAAARLAQNDAARQKELLDLRIVARAAYERAAAEAEGRRAAAEALGQRHRLLTVRRQQEAGDRRGRLDQLAGEIAGLEGEIETTAATIARLQHEVFRRQIRAPVGGRVAELAALLPGAWIEAGERIGAIVAPGALTAVAHFPASEATGRIRSGQPARMRLDGFPWSHYGSVAATVEKVATEAQGGLVRVEFRVDPASAPLIPLQHGLPGALEVEIERATPAALLLRHTGRLLR